MVFLSIPFTSTTALVCSAAAQATSGQAAQEVIDYLNTAQVRRLISKEMSGRPCATDRISNLQALHGMFMKCLEHEWQLQGSRSAELFFVRLAARSPEKAHGVKQEFRFSPENLAVKYRPLGAWRVYVHALCGQLRPHHPAR